MYQGSSEAIQGKELCPPLHLGVVAIEKGAFESPLTTVANFTYLLLLVSKDLSYCEFLSVCFLFLHKLRQIFVEMILSVIGRYSFKRGVCFTVQSTIHLLLIH